MGAAGVRSPLEVHVLPPLHPRVLSRRGTARYGSRLSAARHYMLAHLPSGRDALTCHLSSCALPVAARRLDHGLFGGRVVDAREEQLEEEHAPEHLHHLRGRDRLVLLGRGEEADD
eukprot:3271964-Prymnesium_polylepis.2